MTNLEKITANIDDVAELLYQTDAFENACQLEPDADDDFLSVRSECDEPKGCLVCIKDWLRKEAES